LWPISDHVSQIKPRLPHLKKGDGYCCRIEALRAVTRKLPVKVIGDVLGIAFARRVAGRPPMGSILASYDCREVYYNPEHESKSLIIGIRKMTGQDDDDD
jgi:hypothetical protein